MLDALAGQTIGKWQLESYLASGGMSVLYVGMHVLTKVRAAVKVLRPELFVDPVAWHRFQREVSAAAEIDHVGIVKVLDAGTDRRSRLHYVVMELLSGHDLRSELEGGRLDPAVALRLFDEALSALDAAHRAGFVHRDLKPENIFLSRGQAGATQVKLLDFGIARRTSTDESTHRTQTATAIGTPAYMAPEQMRSARSATPEADVWSMGVILYELLAGAMPFRGDDALALMAAVLTSEPTPLPSSVAAPLAQVVKQCLSRDPAQRPSNAGELQRLLRVAAAAVAPATNVQADPPLPPNGAGRGARAGDAPPVAHVPSSTTKLARAGAVIAVLGTASLAAAAAWSVSSSAPTTEPDGAVDAGDSRQADAAVIEVDPNPFLALGSALSIQRQEVSWSEISGFLENRRARERLRGEATSVLISISQPTADAFALTELSTLLRDPALLSSLGQCADEAPHGQFRSNISLARRVEDTEWANDVHRVEVSVDDGGWPCVGARLRDALAATRFESALIQRRGPFLVDWCTAWERRCAATVIGELLVQPSIEPASDPSAPARGLRFDEARDYCASIGGRLPSFFEWRRAFAGRYPWGNAAPSRLDLHAYLRASAQPTPTTDAALDRSPSGVLNLVSNVLEWTESGASAGVAGFPFLGAVPEPWPPDPALAHQESRAGFDPLPWIGVRCVRGDVGDTTMPHARDVPPSPR